MSLYNVVAIIVQARNTKIRIDIEKMKQKLNVMLVAKFMGRGLKNME